MPAQLVANVIATKEWQLKGRERGGTQCDMRCYTNLHVGSVGLRQCM